MLSAASNQVIFDVERVCSRCQTVSLDAVAQLLAVRALASACDLLDAHLVERCVHCGASAARLRRATYRWNEPGLPPLWWAPAHGWICSGRKMHDEHAVRRATGRPFSPALYLRLRQADGLNAADEVWHGVAAGRAPDDLWIPAGGLWMDSRRLTRALERQAARLGLTFIAERQAVHVGCGPLKQRFDLPVVARRAGAHHLTVEEAAAAVTSKAARQISTLRRALRSAGSATDRLHWNDDLRLYAANRMWSASELVERCAEDADEVERVLRNVSKTSSGWVCGCEALPQLTLHVADGRVRTSLQWACQHWTQPMAPDDRTRTRWQQAAQTLPRWRAVTMQTVGMGARGGVLLLGPEAGSLAAHPDALRGVPEIAELNASPGGQLMMVPCCRDLLAVVSPRTSPRLLREAVDNLSRTLGPEIGWDQLSFRTAMPLKSSGAARPVLPYVRL